MLRDPISVFLWMTALLVYGRCVDAEVELGDLVWSYLDTHPAAPRPPTRPQASA